MISTSGVLRTVPAQTPTDSLPEGVAGVQPALVSKSKLHDTFNQLIITLYSKYKTLFNWACMDIQITHQVTEFDKEELLAGLRSAANARASVDFENGQKLGVYCRNESGENGRRITLLTEKQPRGPCIDYLWVSAQEQRSGEQT